MILLTNIWNEFNRNPTDLGLCDINDSNLFVFKKSQTLKLENSFEFMVHAINLSSSGRFKRLLYVSIYV